jgi:hypothetical protein
VTNPVRLYTVHVVQISNAQKPCLPHQQDIIPYVVKTSVLGSWRWANVYPKQVELILEINKTVIVASSWCSILLYLHWWCTVKHKSSFRFLISRRISLCSLTVSNTSSFVTWSVQLIFSIFLQHHISKLSRYFWVLEAKNCERPKHMLPNKLNQCTICTYI